jgi:hypothetical protein
MNKDRQPFYRGDRVEFNVAPGAWVPTGYDAHVIHEVKTCTWHKTSGWLLEIKGHAGWIGVDWFRKPEEICPMCRERLAQDEAAPEPGFVPVTREEARDIATALLSPERLAKSYIGLLDAVKAWHERARYFERPFTGLALNVVRAAGITE